MTYHQLLTDQQ